MKKFQLFLFMTLVIAILAEVCNPTTSKCCVGTNCCGCQENVSNPSNNSCTPICVSPIFRLSQLSSIPSLHIISPICGQTVNATLSYPSCFVDDIITPANLSGIGNSIYNNNTNLVCEYYKTLTNRFAKGVCITAFVNICLARVRTELLAKQNDTTCTTMEQYQVWVNTTLNNDPDLSTCRQLNVLANFNLGLNYGPNCVDFGFTLP